MKLGLHVIYKSYIYHVSKIHFLEYMKRVFIIAFFQNTMKIKVLSVDTKLN